MKSQAIHQSFAPYVCFLNPKIYLIQIEHVANTVLYLSSFLYGKGCKNAPSRFCVMNLLKKEAFSVKNYFELKPNFFIYSSSKFEVAGVRDSFLILRFVEVTSPKFSHFLTHFNLTLSYTKKHYCYLYLFFVCDKLDLEFEFESSLIVNNF